MQTLLKTLNKNSSFNGGKKYAIEKILKTSDKTLKNSIQIHKKRTNIIKEWKTWKIKDNLAGGWIKIHKKRNNDIEKLLKRQ